MALITISHSAGSGGGGIARQVAKTLNLELYDDRRLKREALKMGVRAEDLKSLNEKIPGFFDRMLTSKPEALRDLMESVVFQFSREGEGVIIGLGSQVLLQGFGCALHVLVHASEANRIQNIMSRQKLNRESAQRLVRMSDHEKTRFFRFAYKLDWDDPSIYDLILNTGKMGTAAAAKIIVEAAQSDEIKVCSLTALETIEKLSQQRLVLATLAKHNFNLGMMDVEVPEKGVVIITGFSYFEEEIHQAVQLVQALPGISDVQSEISHIPPQWD